MAEDWIGETGRKPPVHKLDWKMGWCPECEDLHVDNEILEKAGTADQAEEGGLPKPLVTEVRDHLPDHNYVCTNCGTPMAKSKEEAEEIGQCWYCGNKAAIGIDRFLEKGGK